MKFEHVNKLFTLIIHTNGVKHLLTKHGVTTTLHFVNQNICMGATAMGVKAHVYLCFTLISGSFIVLMCQEDRQTATVRISKYNLLLMNLPTWKQKHFKFYLHTN
jgi:hypothetical protein